VQAKYSEIAWAAPDVQIERQGSDVVFSSDVFVWGITLNWDGDKPVADDVFDLLPGIPYRIQWPEAQPLPKIERIGSKLPW
ncbi:MAG: hypothetical protein WCL39_08130, partial [Armatimonadota bacterium]